MANVQLTVNFKAVLNGLERSIDQVSNKIESAFDSKSLNSFNSSIASISQSLEKISNSSTSDIASSFNGASQEIEKTAESQKRLNTTLEESFDLTETVSREFSELEGTLKAVKDSVTVAATSFGLLRAASSVENARELGKAFSNIGNALGKTAGVVARSSTNVFGFIENLSLLSVGLFGIGNALEQSENELSRFTGTVLKLSGVALGGLSFALGLAVTKIGELAFSVGSQLVSSFQKAAATFSKTEKDLLIFTRTIEGFNKSFGDGVGSLELWTERVNQVSDSTGIARSELQKSAAELVAFGAQAGLGAEELTRLLDISADYSTITGDVFQTTIDFVSALQGSTQGVIKYGVKLNETALETQLLKDGSDALLSELSDQEKVFLRLNKVQSIHNVIKGKAAAISTTLAGQEQRYRSNLERLNGALGEGAAVIEANNIGYAALNVLLNNVSDGVLRATGFFGALGARILQGTGILLKYSLAIFGVVKAFKILQVVLSRDLSKSFLVIGRSLSNFVGQFPVIGQALSQATKQVTIFLARSRNLGEAFNQVSLSAKSGFSLIIRSALGLEKGSLSLTRVIGALAGKAFTALNTSLKLVGRTLLVLAKNPIVIFLTVLAGTVKLVFEALKLINKETGIFTDLFGSATSILAPFRDELRKISDFISGTLTKAFSVSVALINKSLRTILSGVSAAQEFFNIDTSGIDATIAKLDDLDKRLTGGSGNALQADVGNLRTDSSRSIAAPTAAELAAARKNRKELEDLAKTVNQTLETIKRSNQEATTSEFELLKFDRDKLLADINRTLKGDDLSDAIGVVNLKFKLDSEQLGVQNTLENITESASEIINDPAQSTTDKIKALNVELGKLGALRLVTSGDNIAAIENIDEATKRLTDSLKRLDEQSIKKLEDLRKSLGQTVESIKRANLESTNTDLNILKIDRDQLISDANRLLTGNELTEALGVINLRFKLDAESLGVDETLDRISNAASEIINDPAQNTLEKVRSLNNELQRLNVLKDSTSSDNVNAIEAIDSSILKVTDSLDRLNRAKFNALDESLSKVNLSIDKIANTFASGFLDTFEEILVSSQAIDRLQAEYDAISNKNSQEAADKLKEIREAAAESENAWGKAATNIIKDLAKIAAQALITAAITKAIQSFSGGGSVDAAPVQAASGGLISGPGTSTSDSIPARLSNGEFVVKASSVKSLGLDFMNKINNVGNGGSASRLLQPLEAVKDFSKGRTFMEGGFVEQRASSSEAPSVQIVNNGTPQTASSVVSETDASGTVVRIVLEDLQNNGRISRGVANSFGLRRNGAR